MASHSLPLSESFDAIRAGGSVDAMREAMAFVLQELIELEAAQAIGADRYERTDERTTHRNGSRGRLLSTKAGDVELRIPKFRAGSFSPALLEPRRRIDAGISKSEVSRTCAELDAVGTTFRDTHWRTPASRTCSSTRPTSKPTRAPRSSPRPSSSPPG